MERPAKSEVLELTKSLKSSYERINQIAVAYASMRGPQGSIKAIYNKVLNAGIEQSLHTIPVEDLNLSAEGINIQALKASGKNYLSDISNMTPKDLTSINGIGEVMADKIYQTVEASKAQIRKSFRLKISDEDLKSVDIITLLTDIYMLINSDKLPDEAISLAQSVKGKVLENIPVANKLTTGIWLFTSKKEKETRINAYNELCAIKNTGFIEKVSAIDASYVEIKKKSTAENAIASFKTNTAPFFAIIERLCGVTALKDEAEVFGLPRELINKINAFQLDTSNMIATLRNYQEFGTKYILNQQRVLLGDEMGLGKTMQAIAAIAHLKANGATHFIVVCPVSVMVNWGREIEKHSKLSTMRIHGDDREKQFEDFIENGGVAVTTFETIVKLPLEKLLHIDMLTVDEAHYVKNPSAKRTIALKTVASVSDHILLMTGTPLENKVEEMIFLISMLRENLASELNSMLTLSKAPEFRTKAAPVYLRRVREDVLTELPEKLESEEWCDLTAAEKKLYVQALTERNTTACRKLSYDVPDIQDSSKLTRLVELCDQAKEEGRKIIIFSFFLGVLDRVQEALGDRCFGRITGAIPSEERQEIIDKFADTPDGSVMLSQIIAGGVGLNIQCASVVIICEPQWKPSIESQAISRCYRMGQSKSVLVYRLLSDNTVDEDITQLLKYKSDVFDQYADESEIGEVKKSMDEIIEKQRQQYGITNETTTAPSVIVTPVSEVVNQVVEVSSEAPIEVGVESVKVSDDNSQSENTENT